MDEPSEIGIWKRISVLGSGSFGTVSLWQSQSSPQDYIAIKKCKFTRLESLTDKQRIRWKNEVQIMTTLQHPTIVAFKPIPPDLEATLLRYNPSELPLLSMEYCTKGNLRRSLNQIEHSSGLSEEEVRLVLEDIGRAVSFLHTNKITHRDIKPDNIVLQQCHTRPKGLIYKLIDLGYAKELDGTVSFVGTLHYLAPEIMLAQQYNHTVDYWSFGVLAFEVICGVLPFLPQYTPFERFKYIEKKKSEQICIYLRHSGSVAYSEELHKENHISTCFKQELEGWLRNVLNFDPSKRDTVDVFNNLLKILEKKVISVFSVHTLEFYSYEINESTLIGTVKDWISRDTKVPKSEQVLLSEMHFFGYEDEKCIIEILPKADSNLVLIKKGAFINRDTFNLPKYVQMLFHNCTKTYTAQELRHIYIKCLFYLTQEEKLSSTLISAFRVYQMYLNFMNNALKMQLQTVYSNVNTLLLKIECYHSIRVENFVITNKNQAEELKKVLLNAQVLLAAFGRCLVNVNSLVKKVDLLVQRGTTLEELQSKVSPIIDATNFEIFVSGAKELIAKIPMGKVGPFSSKEMVSLISNAVKTKDKLLNNKNFRSYTKATSVAVRDASVLLEWMGEFQIYIRDLSIVIEENQREQYRILLCNPQKKQVINGDSDGDDHVDLGAIVSENQELRLKFEQFLGDTFATYKNMSTEAVSIFNDSF